jgi:nucleoside-diphosphate-sugar epimerase
MQTILLAGATILNEYISTYALSKHQFAEWGKSFANSGALKFINIRLEQLYGPGDDANKFTTHVNFAKNEAVKCYTQKCRHADERRGHRPKRLVCRQSPFPDS